MRDKRYVNIVQPNIWVSYPGESAKAQTHRIVTVSSPDMTKSLVPWRFTSWVSDSILRSNPIDGHIPRCSGKNARRHGMPTLQERISKNLKLPLAQHQLRTSLMSCHQHIKPNNSYQCVDPRQLLVQLPILQKQQLQMVAGMKSRQSISHQMRNIFNEEGRFLSVSASSFSTGFGKQLQTAATMM